MNELDLKNLYCTYDGSQEFTYSATQMPSDYESIKHPLHKFLGTWDGDDIDECLNEVNETRSMF